MIIVLAVGREGLFGRRKVNKLYPSTQSRLVSVPCVFVDGSLLDRFIYEGEHLGKEFLCCLLVFVIYSLPELFYLASEHRLVSLVDGSLVQAPSPLSDRGFVISHIFLLYNDEI